MASSLKLLTKVKSEFGQTGVRNRLRFERHLRASMRDEETRALATKFAAAWAARESEAFLALGHPDGARFYPLVNRPLAGNELGRLNEL